jgi:hypothetical protein
MSFSAIHVEIIRRYLFLLICSKENEFLFEHCFNNSCEKPSFIEKNCWDGENGAGDSEKVTLLKLSKKFHMGLQNKIRFQSFRLLFSTGNARLKCKNLRKVGS